MPSLFLHSFFCGSCDNRGADGATNALTHSHIEIRIPKSGGSLWCLSVFVDSAYECVCEIAKRCARIIFYDRIFVNCEFLR